MMLVAGALLGLISVAFGAWVAHAPQAAFSSETLQSVQTAMEYHQIHAVVVTVIGLLRLQRDAAPYPGSLAWAGWGFVAGTLLFSFSIYLSAVTGDPALNAAAPVGGTVLMASWAALAWTGLRSLRS